MTHPRKYAAILGAVILMLLGSLTARPASATIYHAGMSAQARPSPFGLEVDVMVSLVTQLWTQPFGPTAQVIDGVGNSFWNWTSETRYYSLPEYYNSDVPCCIRASLFVWQGTFTLTELPLHVSLTADVGENLDIGLPNGLPFASLCSPLLIGRTITTPTGRGCGSANPNGYDVRDLLTGETIGTVSVDHPFELPVGRSGPQLLAFYDGVQGATMLFEIPAPGGVGLLAIGALAAIRLASRRSVRSNAITPAP